MTCAWSALPEAASRRTGCCAVAGEQGKVDCQRRSVIVALLPRLELPAEDDMVTYASAKMYTAQANAQAWRTEARAEQAK